MVRLISLLVVCSLHAAAYSQGTFPELDVRINGVPGGGYILAAPISRDSIALVDLSGRAVFPRSVGFHTNLQAYGTRRLSVFTGNYGYLNYVILDSALMPIDTVVVTPPYSTDSHEGVMWSDTTFMMLGLDFRPFDMSGIVQGGQTNASLMATVLQERHLSTDSVLFEWNAFGRIPVTDATADIELRQRTIDYIHANSIARDTDGDMIISCRHLDEIIKIRRSDGSIVWRFGGVGARNRRFTFINDDHDSVQGFSHQHNAFRTRRGTIMLFDNGNLKPIQKSRVVEYALDTVAMTATRVWSYTPDPPLYSPSQGSVQELENGNILIGYSSTSDPRVAEEVDRNGAVVVQIRNASQVSLQPYRVTSTTIGCTSVMKTITTAGASSFATADSSTGITVDVSSLADSTQCRVERHHYRPHSFNQSDSTACGPLSMRWTVRFDSAAGLTGSMRFDGREVASPSTVIVHHRGQEGTGDFRTLRSRFDPTSGDIVVDTIVAGEFAMSFTLCPESIPILPRRAAVNVPLAAMLRWSESPDASAYDLQVSLQSDMTAALLDVTTSRRDTVITGLPPATQIYWRVRKRTGTSTGQWSEPWTFTTKAPVSVTDTDHPSIDVRLVGNAIEVTSATTPLRGIKVFDLLGQLIGSALLEPGLRSSRAELGTLPRIVIVVLQHGNGSVTQQLLVRD